MPLQLAVLLFQLTTSLTLLTTTLQTTQAEAQVMTPIDMIQLHAAEFGANAKDMVRVMECESQGNANAVNYNDAKITGYPSYGIFQFQPNTYKAWSKEIGETRDIMNVDAQIRVAAYGFSKGRQKAWSCWTKK